MRSVSAKPLEGASKVLEKIGDRYAILFGKNTFKSDGVKLFPWIEDKRTLTYLCVTFQLLGDIYYSNHYKNVVTSFAGEIRDRGVGVTSDHVFILGVDKVDFIKIPHVCQGCWTTVFVIYKGGFNNGRYMIKSENTGAKTGYFDCHGPPKPTVERSCIIGDSGEVTGFTGLISQIDIYKGTDLLSIPNALRDLLFFDHRPKDYTLYDGNLDKLRMNEQCSYFFSSKGDFILNHTGVIAGLKSQSIIRNRDAMERAALWGSLKIEKIPGTEFLAVRIVGNTSEVKNVNIAQGNSTVIRVLQ